MKCTIRQPKWLQEMLVCIDEQNYECRRYLNTVGIYNELLPVKFFRLKAFDSCWSVSRLSFVTCWHLFVILGYNMRLGFWIVCFSEDFVKSRFVLSTFPIHFIVTLVGLISIVRYTEDSVIKRFVKSRFHCSLICFLIWVFFYDFVLVFFQHKLFTKSQTTGKNATLKRERKKNTNPTKKGMWPSCLLLVNPSMLWIVQGSIHLRKCQTNHTYKNLIYKKNVYYS